MIVERALKNASFSDPSKLKGIAVPLGPGPIFSNKVGIEFAKALGSKFDVPVIPINLLEAEAFSPRFVTE
jgi:tRNA A37 threonylcarbamoyltransferase TsaD